jgi:phosphoribosyl-ATP pyrophosphohydrolase/phosphoribosyl-AMP cyclohydrolase
MTLDELKWDPAGLVTVVAQDRHTGELRMVAHANREAVQRTAADGVAWFWSRSRAALWKKGEQSGNTLRVAEMWADCDGDAVLYLVEPSGPTCHTGHPSCFFRSLDGATERRAAPTLLRLSDTLEARATEDAARSYTRSLLEAGATKIARKLREEADELGRAIDHEPDPRVASEAADVLYHVMVGLLSRQRSLRDVAQELARRFGRSGHEEKASR